MVNYVLYRRGIGYVKIYKRLGAFGRDEYFKAEDCDLNSATVFGKDLVSLGNNLNLDSLVEKLLIKGYVKLEANLEVVREVTLTGRIID